MCIRDSSSGLNITPQVMTLNPQLGFLRGGSGGGGGGGSIHTTKTNGLPLMCDMPIPPFSLMIQQYFTHSAAGGGGGGGAVQVNAGGRASIDGVMDVSGGPGGSSFGVPSPSQLPPNNNSAAPGGGGSGGALLLQAFELVISSTPGRIDVSGGPGGTQNSAVLSMGGEGSPGLVRLESQPPPLGSPPPITAVNEAFKILPFDPADDESTDFLSVGPLTVVNQGEGAFSGAQSCWIQPEGNFFQVTFIDDDFSDPANPVPGWDMDIVFSIPGLGPLPFRGLNGLFGTPMAPISIEDVVGSDLKGSNPAPIVVRFQGVRAIKEIEDFCNVDLSLTSEDVVSESLTGWVRHPAELNTYWDFMGPEAAAALRSNMIRFQIIFDNSTNLFPGTVLGVTNFAIQAQPD